MQPIDEIAVVTVAELRAICIKIGTLSYIVGAVFGVIGAWFGMCR